jgi:hypothetical protein
MNHQLKLSVESQCVMIVSATLTITGIQQLSLYLETSNNAWYWTKGKTVHKINLFFYVIENCCQLVFQVLSTCYSLDIEWIRRECPKSENDKGETVTASALNQTSNAEPVASRFIDCAGDPSVGVLLGSPRRTVVSWQFISHLQT